jgi:hypothetical protein
LIGLRFEEIEACLDVSERARTVSRTSLKFCETHVEQFEQELISASNDVPPCLGRERLAGLRPLQIQQHAQ